MISVVVSTYRRPDGALRCVESLLRQTHRDAEVVVADNGGGDDLAESLAALKGPLPVRYVHEPRLGLHNARHAGARAARGTLLVFTDDDVTAAERWLAAYSAAFDREPELVAAGGPVRPEWERPPPEWLLRYLAGRPHFGPLALIDAFDEFRVGKEVMLFGNNMAVRRDALEAAGGFGPELRGGLTVGDGESGLLRRLRERGGPIGYVPDAVVQHHVPAERMTVEYLERWTEHLAATELYPRYAGAVPGRGVLAAHGLAEAARLVPAALAAQLVRGRTDPSAIDRRIEAARRGARLAYLARLARDPSFRRLVAHTDWLSDPL